MRELRGAQQSDAWLAARRGRITASRCADMMATLKRGGEAAARRNYRMELVAERLTGRCADHYVSMEMEHGSAKEAEAISRYEMATGEMVTPVGFVLHPRFDFAGASPDGLVGPDGLVEAKCPKTETILGWMESGKVPEEYLLQIQMELACTGRRWAHFLAFDDRLPSGAQDLVIEVRRDEATIALIESEAERFNAEIEAFIAKLGMPATVWRIDEKREEATGYDPSRTLEENCDFLDAANLTP